jgi:hypothetical protein
MYGVMEEKKLWWAKEKEMGEVGVTHSAGPATCVNGDAGGYPCNGLDMQSMVSLEDLGCGTNMGNDIWYDHLSFHPDRRKETYDGYCLGGGLMPREMSTSWLDARVDPLWSM